MTEKKPSKQEVDAHELTEEYAQYLAAVEKEMSRIAGRPMKTANIGHLQLIGYSVQQTAQWLMSFVSR